MSRKKASRITPVEWLARAGYGSRGLVYLTIGVFTLLGANELREDAIGTDQALQTFARWPMGSVLLALLAAGLGGFVMWRLAQAVFDADRVGSKKKALAKRAGQGISAAIYAALAWSCLEAIDGIEDFREGESEADSFRAVLELPYGDLLLIAIGAGVFIAGGLNVLHGLQGRFRRHLTGDQDLHRWTVPVARAGYFSRGLVFLAVGFFLVEVAFDLASLETASIGGALQELERQPFGSALMGFMGVGLAAFGAFGLIEARYRRIVVPEAMGG